ncbi:MULTISPECIES: alpha/beta hydrolase [unclassified Nocardioides]|uniref:alpha/beta hydrolase n=1 Tax=unclassified Nocardioides TaxID=2615069 RepID=UPI00361D330E
MTTTDLPVRIAPAAPRRTGVGVAAVAAVLNTTARLSPRVAGRLALELWRRPGRPVGVRAGERAVHDAARVEVVEHAGSEVTTYAWGDGARPVLVVHGWGARASRFADVVAALLATGHSPVAYDAWGHGATRGPVRTILEHRAVVGELERRHGPFVGVVAHSFGVPVALYAVRTGLSADRVVAVSGMGDFGYLVDTFCDRLGLDARVGVALRRAIERNWFAGDTGIWADFSPQAVPGTEVLVVHDAGDRVVDRGQADVLVAALGDGTRLVETTGLGHGRILHDPAVVAEAVAFLDGAPT